MIAAEKPKFDKPVVISAAPGAAAIASPAEMDDASASAPAPAPRLMQNLRTIIRD
jgi:hypothetical protein